MNDELREAAARAAVWGVVAAAALERQKEAKAELAQLEVGDTIAGKINDQIVAKVSWTKGRQKLEITDEPAFLHFVKVNHPSELVQTVNPAFLKALEAKAKQVGAVIDRHGELVPGADLITGDAYLSVRREPDAETTVAALLSSGRIGLEGLDMTAIEGAA